MCFYVSLTNALFVPLAFCFGMPSLPQTNCLVIYLLLAVIDIAYLYPYYVALKKTDTSVVSSLFAIGKVFIPIMSFWVLNDILMPRQYLGFFIIISVSLILNIKRGISFKVNQAFYLMFLSSLLLSCRVILAKVALTADNAWTNTIIYPNLISGGLIFTFFTDEKFQDRLKALFPRYSVR